LIGLTTSVVEQREAATRAEHQQRVEAEQAKVAERLTAEWQQAQQHARALANPDFAAALDIVTKATVDGGMAGDEGVAAAIFTRAAEVYRAHRAAQREYEIRASFAAPNFADGIKGREQKLQPEPPTMADIAARLPLQADGRAAQHAENVDSFREQFAAEAGRSRQWTEDMRAGAAASERAATEVKIRAEQARNRR
jgi:hypothetical protein